MKLEHKLIMERAAKEGLLPSELASELIVHDLVNATRAQMSRYEVGYNKMTEKQQDAVLAELQDNFKGIADIVARIIAGAGTPAVPMTLKDLKISNGTLTGIVDGGEKYFNELISKVQDKSDVLVVLYERQYSDALDAIQSEKDQRALPLDSDAANPASGKKPRATKAKAEAKPIELPPKLIDDARKFVTEQQNASFAGLQNQLKIGFGKAEALLQLLETEGLVTFVGTDQNGQYDLVRAAKAEPAEPAEPSAADVLDFHASDAQALEAPVAPTDLTDDLYDKIKAKVIADQSVSAGALSVAFDLSDELATQAVDRLELEGVVSEADDFENREVYEQPE